MALLLSQRPDSKAAESQTAIPAGGHRAVSRTHYQVLRGCIESVEKMKRKALILILILAVAAAALFSALTRRPRAIVLTGIVTTDQVIVSSEIQGRLQRLLVKEGDSATNGQLLAIIQPQEWKADVAFYASGVEQSSAQIAQAEADLKYQEAQTSNQIRQAEATLASTEAQRKQVQADLENASLSFEREKDLYQRGVDSKQAFD